MLRQHAVIGVTAKRDTKFNGAPIPAGTELLVRSRATQDEPRPGKGPFGERGWTEGNLRRIADVIGYVDLSRSKMQILFERR